MANEKRLIDANELKKKISANFEQCFYSPFCEIQIAEETIDDAPTVDAVEVVQCKDCKQWCRNIGITESPNGHCFYHDIETNGHDFCSYGERRTK